MLAHICWDAWLSLLGLDGQFERQYLSRRLISSARSGQREALCDQIAFLKPRLTLSARDEKGKRCEGAGVLFTSDFCTLIGSSSTTFLTDWPPYHRFTLPTPPPTVHVNLLLPHPVDQIPPSPRYTYTLPPSASGIFPFLPPVPYLQAGTFSHFPCEQTDSIVLIPR